MKSRNLTQISLRNDPINRRMQGFSFRIFEDKSGVQDVISSFSFNKSLISRIQLKRKRVKNTLEQRVFEDWSRTCSSSRRTGFKNNENDFGPSDGEIITMNGSDNAPFRESSRSDVERPIFDQGFRFHLVFDEEGNMWIWSPVGLKSNARDELEVICDGRPRFIHLSE